jgi:hypothetical protein
LIIPVAGIAVAVACAISLAHHAAAPSRWAVRSTCGGAAVAVAKVPSVPVVLNGIVIAESAICAGKSIWIALAIVCRIAKALLVGCLSAKVIVY